jgi:hypothetical protein
MVVKAPFCRIVNAAHIANVIATVDELGVSRPVDFFPIDLAKEEQERACCHFIRVKPFLLPTVYA